MAGMNVGLTIIFISSVGFQLLAISMLPLTEGLTKPIPTSVGALGFLIGMGLLARLVNSGVTLSTVIPLMSTAVPIASIAMGVLFFGDSASALKIVALVAACVLIGLASRL
jgi:multidrug transporter EmrE-like cation transporter